MQPATNTRISPEAIATIDTLAARWGLSRSAAVARAVLVALAAEGETP